jgi:glycine cleavage system regulatory protein
VRVDLVLTIIGLDRPGLVELVSRTVTGHEGNWEASRMARMAGRFAGILQVSVPDERAEALAAALAALDAEGLRVVVERVPEPAEEPGAGVRRFRVELVGNDRPGVIRDVSSALAERGVNVEELATECASAPMAGGALLRVSALVRAPSELAPDQLRRLIETRAPDFMVDLAPAAAPSEPS